MPTPAPSYRKKPPKRIGGALCLDFVNTVSWRGDPQEPGERLTSYSELLLWAVHAGVLEAPASRALDLEAERRPDDARRVVESARELREALARILASPRGGAGAEIELLNAMLSAAPARQQIRVSGSGYAWAADRDDGAVDGALHSVLWPVLWSAADLLTSPARTSVRRCGDSRCAWIFLDTSPSGRRRWCSMDACGNRAKARRFHRASRSAKSRRAR